MNTTETVSIFNADQARKAVEDYNERVKQIQVEQWGPTLEKALAHIREFASGGHYKVILTKDNDLYEGNALSEKGTWISTHLVALGFIVSSEKVCGESKMSISWPIPNQSNIR